MLESIAILPQLILLHRTQPQPLADLHWIATLGLYRVMYLPNWALKYSLFAVTHATVWTAGIIQALLYCEFFVYYARRYVLSRMLARVWKYSKD